MLIFRLLRCWLGKDRFVALQRDRSFPKAFVFDREATARGEVAVRFVRNGRARRYILRVIDEATIRVTIPRGGSRGEAFAFFQRNHEWATARLKEATDKSAQALQPWQVGTKVWYRGRKEPIIVDCGMLRVCSLEIGEVKGELDLRVRIEGALRSQAEAEIPGRVYAYAKLMGVAPRRVTIRGQRTRWGSCSAKGNLSLNWRLVQVPEEVRDYVVIHELCHLRQMNHSSRFWDLVRSVCPNYREHEVWLRAHSAIPSGFDA